MTEKGPRILARTLFHQMRDNGYSVNQILAFANELIGLLSSSLREQKRSVLAGEPVQVMSPSVKQR
jgi:hypothetical protein